MMDKSKPPAATTAPTTTAAATAAPTTAPTAAATMAPTTAKETGHPYNTSDQDLVAVEVVYAKGVRYHGKMYRLGATFTMTRADALAANTPDRKVFRVLRTVRYANGPADQAEEAPAEGPLVLD